MFNLEQSIADWRRQMLAAGIKAESLEELDSHVREEIEKQIQSGVSEQQAFEIAMYRIGRAGEIKGEFKKSCGPKFLRMGAIGLALTPILNLMGLFVFHRSSSVFFSDQWCSAWLPCYLVWATLFVVGVANLVWNRREIWN